MGYENVRVRGVMLENLVGHASISFMLEYTFPERNGLNLVTISNNGGFLRFLALLGLMWAMCRFVRSYF